MEHIHPVVLVILDGFGYSLEKQYNAIAHASMPYFKEWWHKYPHAILQAAGTAVGLPEGFAGNSEVGHLTLGAGRIIKQPMTLWLESIEDGSFEDNQVLLTQLRKLVDTGGALHIIGLLSDAGVHAHEKQIQALIAVAVNAGIKKIVVHAILDGRDVAPQSAYNYLGKLEQYIKPYNDCLDKKRVIMGSVQGRFYAMDRDGNWDRTEKSYRVLTEQQDIFDESWQHVLESNYVQSITDEFIPPTQLTDDCCIKNGDGIFFCNVRPDRARQLTRAFIIDEFDNFIVKPLNLTFFITPVVYDVDLPTTVLFPRNPIYHTLKDVLAHNNKTIFSIAETEKYAHVTYFFRGENEQAVKNEERILIPSIKAHDYIKYPEMSAKEITERVLQELDDNKYDFYLVNYANADMVGHSGDFDATVKAVEFLDKQLKQLYDIVVEKMNGTLFITADHGKAEQMYNDVTAQSQTGHTINPVPFLMINKKYANNDKELSLEGLSDVAPFILQEMGLKVPDEMMR